jgi:3-isopropylmalate/(R)-2-methylmalate dehydratase small subunit
MPPSGSVARIAGTCVPVRGNDIDTDRIIPARYLRAITFEGLGEHAFEDDRKSGGHPFDDARYQGASILLGNANFGCGSSREHAPQALLGWGIQAVVAVSFAEIFLGNCTAMGVPCATLPAADMERLMLAVEAQPEQAATLDLKGKTLTFGDETYPVSLPEGNRIQLLEGAWDATGMLMEAKDAVATVAARLPYIAGF